MAKKSSEKVSDAATQADLGNANSEIKSGEIDNTALDTDAQDGARPEKGNDSSDSGAETGLEGEAEYDAKTKTAATLEIESEKPSSDVSNETNIIHPVAVDIRLREIYPHESYGRCGLRFKKGQPQRIAFAALEPEALLELENDPWLALEYVCE